MKDRERVSQLYRTITNANWQQALATQRKDEGLLFRAIADRRAANQELLQLAESWGK